MQPGPAREVTGFGRGRRAEHHRQGVSQPNTRALVGPPVRRVVASQAIVLGRQPLRHVGVVVTREVEHPVIFANGIESGDEPASRPRRVRPAWSPSPYRASVAASASGT